MRLHKGGASIMRKFFSQTVQKNRDLFCCLVLFAAGLVYCLPSFLMTGISHYVNEDTYFHLNRVIGLRNVFRSPVNFMNFAHNGPMVNIFYPWLTMYPMYLFYKLAGSYEMGYKLYYLFLTFLTLLTAYFVMMRISKDRTCALCFAILYTYSAYRFINVFRRAHLGEAISITALLLVLLGVYSVFFGNFKQWGSLASGMALIAYSHNLFLLITSFIVAIIFLISFCFMDHKRERIVSLIKAAAAALFFSAGSFGPILEYSHLNQLYTPGGSGEGLKNSAYSLRNIIEKSLRNEPVSYAVGFWVVTALICLLLYYGYTFFQRRKPSERGYRKNPPVINIFFITGAIIFISASSVLPWEWIGYHTPLYIIQFVWRLNAHSSILLLTAFCYSVSKFLKSQKSKVMVVGLILILAPALHYSAFLKLLREENARLLEPEISAGDAITFDYAASTAKQFRNENGYTMDVMYINDLPFPIEKSFSDDGSVCTVIIDVSQETDGTVTADIPVFWYNTQKCTVNGEKVTTRLSDRGTTLVDLVPNDRNTVSISYEHTKITWFFWTVSFISAILFVVFHISKKRS